MNRLIVMMIRKRLGLKKFEKFNFKNQKNKKEVYYFTTDCLMKEWIQKQRSTVSLNFLLSDECHIERAEK